MQWDFLTVPRQTPLIPPGPPVLQMENAVWIPAELQGAYEVSSYIFIWLSVKGSCVEFTSLLFTGSYGHIRDTILDMYNILLPR
jgi:hypothetical protein